MVRNSDPRRYNNPIRLARRSVELDDDKVVSEYEEDWPEGGIGSAIRVSCPSYLEPIFQLRQIVKFLNFKFQLTLCQE